MFKLGTNSEIKGGNQRVKKEEEENTKLNNKELREKKVEMACATRCLVSK